MSSKNILLDYITPDWSATFDSKQMVQEIPGFQFLGAGWYNRDKSWMLIIHSTIPDIYDIQVFFDRDPRAGFIAMADAPIRVREPAVPQSNPPNVGGLLLLLIGMVVMIPIAALLLHKFGAWGILMTLVMVLVGSRTIWIFNKPKNQGKKR